MQAGRRLVSELVDHRINGNQRAAALSKERLKWCSAPAARAEPADETNEEVEHAENDEAGGDDIVAGTAAVCLGLGIRVGDRGDGDAHDSHERAAYH